MTAQSRALTPAERRTVATVAVATAFLGLLGFANSFTRVQAAAGSSFGHLAWTVPLGVDVGIATFSALDIVLARLDMRMRALRLIPWTLTAATVYLNIADETTWFGRIAHAVLPGLWVVAVEVAAHTARLRAGLAAGTHMDRVRRARWVLAFPSTARLWRRMVLWEVRSYPVALTRERDRLLAKTALQDVYGGFAWRWRAPRRERMLFRLGELVPADLGAVAGGAEVVSDIVLAGSTTAESTPVEGPEAVPDLDLSDGVVSGVPEPRDTTPAPDDLPVPEEVYEAGVEIADRLFKQGIRLSRRNLQDGLRDAGKPTGNKRALALLQALQFRAGTDLDTTPDTTPEPVSTAAVR